MILSADILDDKTLTDIALQSKAHWKYTKELLESWQDDLTVTQEMIAEMNVFKFVIAEKIAGFYILNQPEDTSIELEFLFVHPDFMGKRIGEKLLLHAFEFAKNLLCNTMNVLSDPNAASFYQRFGFEIIDQKKSSVKGRFLPVMVKYFNLYFF